MTKDKENTIITAADAYYFRSMCQFIYTYQSTKEYKNSTLICYDMGFDEEQKQYFDRLSRKIPGLYIRVFDFSKYPAFVGLSHKTYSFKPIIIKEVMEEKKGNIFWLDSATILQKNLSGVWRTLDQHGSYTPKSGTGTLKDWTVQATLDYMDAPESIYNNRNFSGGVCAFSYHNEHVRELVAEWKRYALIHECIKPEGANRTNHRDDQSVLSILLYQYEKKYQIVLTNDEVNISSKNPTQYLTVMNKLKPSFPKYLNLFSVLYFNFYSKLDVIVNRIKS
jgi:hypothetical protein